MSGSGALVIAVLFGLPIGLLLVGSKSSSFSMYGLFERDKKGKVTMTVWPASKPKRKTRRRR